MRHTFLEIRKQVMEAKQWASSLENYYDLPTFRLVRIYRKHFKNK